MVIEIALGIVLGFIFLAALPLLARIILILIPVASIAYVVWYIMQ